jgi:hypothetical protein
MLSLHSIPNRTSGIPFAKFNWYQLPCQTNDSHKQKCASAGEGLFLSLVRRNLLDLNLIIENNTSVAHIQYVMDNILSLSPAKQVYIFAHWGSCREIIEYLNATCSTRPVAILP